MVGPVYLHTRFGAPASSKMVTFGDSSLTSGVDSDHPSGAAPDPGAILAMANDDLSLDNESQTFVTVVLGVIDGLTGQGRITVAGHDLPVVLGSAGPRLLAPLRRQPALGVMEGIGYTADDFALTPGEALFCYSDGVSEAENNEGGFFGQPRLMAVLAQAGTAPDAVVDSVLRAVAAFAQGAPQADDITVLAFHYAG
jgi:sigma-B regulation protein RsbU (phosphoserine phosphatase)